MSNPGKVVAVAVLVALGWAAAPVAEAQSPIRIGATLPQTGVYATAGQNLHRG
jgi:ABC-type branched-subunit amino acid transport system substrate-binding protein